jgi:acetyl-CoA C-acetyltransferase
MALDPRTPVVVGVGQITNRVDTGCEPREPVDLIVAAARDAADDCGAPRVLAGTGCIRLAHTYSWRYQNAARLVADRLGIGDVRTVEALPVGALPQRQLGHAAADIAAGRVDTVLIGGAEAWRSRLMAGPFDTFFLDGDDAWQGTLVPRSSTDAPGWTHQPDDVQPPERFGTFDIIHPSELAAGVTDAPQIYAMFEHAARARAGRTIDEDLAVIGALIELFCHVAAANPHAWTRTPATAEQIRTLGPGNRLIAHPYTKLMCANERVDQGAALLLTSVARARALGIPTERWVFPHAMTWSCDTYISHRHELGRSPMAEASAAALQALTGREPAAAEFVDLYSCFPSTVQILAASFGLPLDRPLTVTGGLRFAGGPASTYVTHALAALVGRLRERPGTTGLCAGVGGWLTYLSLGQYSTAPPAAPFRLVEVDDPGGATRRESAPDATGPATVETYTAVPESRAGPARGIVACLLADGRRTWGNVTDAALAASMLEDDWLDQPVTVDAARTVTVR